MEYSAGMKQSKQCPRCSGRKIIHLASVADASDYYGAGTGDMSQRTGSSFIPRTIAERVATSRGLFGGTSTSVEPACPTEAYICAGCGYLEEYVKSPGDIDWAEINGATWHSQG